MPHDSVDPFTFLPDRKLVETVEGCPVQQIVPADGACSATEKVNKVLLRRSLCRASGDYIEGSCVHRVEELRYLIPVIEASIGCLDIMPGAGRAECDQEHQKDASELFKIVDDVFSVIFEVRCCFLKVNLIRSDEGLNTYFF